MMGKRAVLLSVVIFTLIFVRVQANVISVTPRNTNSVAPYGIRCVSVAAANFVALSILTSA